MFFFIVLNQYLPLPVNVVSAIRVNTSKSEYTFTSVCKLSRFLSQRSRASVSKHARKLIHILGEMYNFYCNLPPIMLSLSSVVGQTDFNLKLLFLRSMLTTVRTDYLSPIFQCLTTNSSHAGAINTLLFGFASVWAILISHTEAQTNTITFAYFQHFSRRTGFNISK